MAVGASTHRRDNRPARLSRLDKLHGVARFRAAVEMNDTAFVSDARWPHGALGGGALEGWGEGRASRLVGGSGRREIGGR